MGVEQAVLEQINMDNTKKEKISKAIWDAHATIMATLMDAVKGDQTTEDDGRMESHNEMRAEAIREADAAGYDNF